LLHAGSFCINKVYHQYKLYALSKVNSVITNSFWLPNVFLKTDACYNQGSISSTFYEQLLPAHILQAQKRQSGCQSFLRFRDLRPQKLIVEL